MGVSNPENKTYILSKAMQMNPKTVLDVGAGKGYYAKMLSFWLPDTEYTAVEVWEPYINYFGLHGIYDKVIQKDVREIDDFGYDLVIFGDVLEHMSEKDALAVWDKVSQQAKYAIISVPIIHHPQEEVNGNPYEVHVEEDWSTQRVLSKFKNIVEYEEFEVTGAFVADFGAKNVEEFRTRTEGNAFPARGGTEILMEGLQKHTSIADYPKINLILSTPSYSTIKYTKKNVLWQHLNYNDESLTALRDPAFLRTISSFVYVSNWQLEKFRYLYQTPLDKATVIKNAIEPIEFKPRTKEGKLKLIYPTTPFRGLEVLLDAFENLDRDDVELDVYSSTSIYGSGFMRHTGDQYDSLFNRAKAAKNVNFMGYAPNEKVKEALQEAHIYAYPSIFEETSCLGMIEAGAAGCKMVTTNLGALFETGSEWATMVPMQATADDLTDKYTVALGQAIDDYWNTDVQESLRHQSDFYNEFYNWERRAKEWNRLFYQLS